MISSKELQYVSQFANKTPMPGEEYSLKVLNEIKKCVEVYKEKYQDKEYNIIFSNSEEIVFEIYQKNLCHMLGIDYANLRGDYFEFYREYAFGSPSSNISSYQLLELIIENMEKVAELDNDPKNKAKAINYYKSAIKCAIFNKLSNFDKFNFAAINYFDDSKNFDYNNKKLFFIPSNEALVPYFMMGITKESTEVETDKYCVYTLFAPDKPQSFFDNQEVIIPTQIMISNNENLIKNLATPEEKIQLLTMYSNIINKYGLQNRINIYGDYASTLNELSNSPLLERKK